MNKRVFFFLILIFSPFIFANEREVVIEWDKIDGAYKYEVDLYQGKSEDALKMQVGRYVSEVTEWKTILNPGNYFFRVRSVAQDGTEGTWGKWNQLVIYGETFRDKTWHTRIDAVALNYHYKSDYFEQNTEVKDSMTGFGYRFDVGRLFPSLTSRLGLFAQINKLGSSKIGSNYMYNAGLYVQWLEMAKGRWNFAIRDSLYLDSLPFIENISGVYSKKNAQSLAFTFEPQISFFLNPRWYIKPVTSVYAHIIDRSNSSKRKIAPTYSYRVGALFGYRITRFSMVEFGYTYDSFNLNKTALTNSAGKDYNKLNLSGGSIVLAAIIGF